MKTYYLLFTALLFFNFNVLAQFSDGFEDCENDGDPASGCEFPWIELGCGCMPGCYIICSSGEAHTGDWSGLIPGDGTTDAILDLGNRIFAQWGLEFWMYIPSDKEAYWNLQGEIPVGSGEWIVGNVFFNQDLANSGIGLIDDTALGEVNFNFPHDQWFRIVMNWDIELGISLATWQFNVDGVDVIPFGTPFTNYDGTTPTSLGGIDFFSISTDNELYLDDFNFINGFIDTEPNPIPLTDDMESYTEGEAIYEGWWIALWGDGLGSALESTSAQAYSGNLSGLVPGDSTTEAILDLGSKINGTWGVEYWAYIPSNKEAFWGVNGCVPICTDGDWLLYTLFNESLNSPGEGVVVNSSLGEVSFSFPPDQWFKTIINVDLTNGMSQATWQYIIDGVEVIPLGTSLANDIGQFPVSFGGLEFYSTSTINELYIDDFNYIEGVILATNDIENIEFKIYPNPAINSVNISSTESIEKINIYSIHGILVKETTNNKTIDVSNLSNGIYFIEVLYEKGKKVQKLIKN